MKFITILLTFLPLCTSFLTNSIKHRGSSINAITAEIITETNVVESPKTLLLNGVKSRTLLNELVLKLEKENPTKDPAFSPLLNGVWEITVSGITAPGLIIYQVSYLHHTLAFLLNLTELISNIYYIP